MCGLAATKAKLQFKGFGISHESEGGGASRPVDGGLASPKVARHGGAATQEALPQARARCDGVCLVG